MYTKNGQKIYLLKYVSKYYFKHIYVNMFSTNMFFGHMQGLMQIS